MEALILKTALITTGAEILIVVVVLCVLAGGYGVTASLLDRRRSRQIEADLSEQIHLDEEQNRKEQ